MNLGDLIGSDPMLRSKAEGAVHVGVSDGAARIRLECETFHLPHLAQAFEQLIHPNFVVTTRESLVETLLALKDLLGAGESGLGEVGRDHTGVGGPSGVEPLCP
jgi:hypothetical protein